MTENKNNSNTVNRSMANAFWYCYDSIKKVEKVAFVGLARNEGNHQRYANL